MASVTAIIPTKNEEKNLADCLNSLKGFVERAVVVDCGSTDRTVEIAQACGAEVVFHEFQYSAAQFNWAFDNVGITTDWIMRFDADERMTPALIAETEAILNSDEALHGDVNGITMEATFYFLGRPILHGLHKKRKMILFKRGIGRIEDRKRDAHALLSEGRSVSTKERFLHYDYKDLTSYIKRYNWYAIRELQDYIAFTHGASTDVDNDPRIRAQRKKKFGLYYRAPKFLRAWLWFVYNYIFRLGFLDGKEGFLFHYFECLWYRLLVDAKIYEYEKLGGEMEELRPLD